MIRVGFIFTFSKNYKGGINYLKNLMYSISINNFNDLECYVFVPPDIEDEYVDLFSPYAKVIKTDLLKKYSFKWFVNKVFVKLINKPVLLFKLFKRYKINVISHSWLLQKSKAFKVVNWIPDFQCLHYPDLWSKEELKSLTKYNHDIVKQSDIVILSSNDAFVDYKSFAPHQIDKVKVLQFVSQPGQVNDVNNLYPKIREKYQLGNNFFYLPNQFWSHKNHIIVFKAINLLVKKGLNPLLVTTGLMNDFRGNNQNLVLIQDYIKQNNLEKNILLLGLIPYEEVLILMHKCKAVINPSFFEGWSSTIEEAKSIGKTVILSDIPVHREQNPNNAFYFNPNNEDELSVILENVWNKDGNGSSDLSKELKEELKQDLVNRTKVFSESYYKIIKDLVSKN